MKGDGLRPIGAYAPEGRPLRSDDGRPVFALRTSPRQAAPLGRWNTDDGRRMTDDGGQRKGRACGRWRYEDRELRSLEVRGKNLPAANLLSF